MIFFQEYLATPIGDLLVQADQLGLVRVEFVDLIADINLVAPASNVIVDAAISQLSEYFAGDRQVFDLPLRAQGTDFRRHVWQCLLKIPYGQTACYADIAKAMNNEKAVRAVGSANGANPIAIIVPCHRVIGKDGSLTGYAGGLDRKQWLLDFEGTISYCHPAKP